MSFRRNALRAFALIIVATFALLSLATDIPSAPASDVDAYNIALNHPRISDRITGLEVFATNHRGSPLAEDALEFALWYYVSTGGRARTLDVAAQLQRVNPDNPLALAVLAHDRRSAAESNLDTERNLREVDRMTNRGLQALNYMRHPQGMTYADFTAMKRQVIALLEGDAGYIALQNKRYNHAQLLLKNAVDADPESTQNVYALALSYLNSPKPDRKNGYYFLARTVNLTQGTPAGEQIAQFAAEQYRHDGGTPQNWNQFLAVTRVTGAPAATTPAPQVVVAKADTSQKPVQPPPAQVASATPQPEPKSRDTADRTAKQRDKNKDNRDQQTVARADIPKDLPPDTRTPDTRTPEEPKGERKPGKDDRYSSGIWKSPGSDTPPAPGPIYKRPANGSPVSLGILIESAHLSKGERDALVRGITGILDSLRDSDEAFILTYGDELVFEQDLTHQPWLLQDAMSHMKAHGGDQGLYDAIATSAAHLRRIAKNQNRVLLLVSDGESSQKSKRNLDLAWSVREVTVNCMAIDIGSETDRRFLEALASRTGGHTIFVHSLSEFPSVSQQMARNIYGPMQ